jgi:hypothetical protein
MLGIRQKAGNDVLSNRCALFNNTAAMHIHSRELPMALLTIEMEKWCRQVGRGNAWTT